MLNLKVKYEELKDFMKRKTAVFLLSLFFVTSVVAISTVNNGEHVTLVGDYEQYEAVETTTEQFDDAEPATLTEIDEPTLLVDNSAEDSNYITDSAVVLVETKADKQRLKVQEKQLKRGKQKQLTANLNKQAKQALQQQINENGKPVRVRNNNNVAIAKPANSQLSLQPSKPTQLASLTAEQSLIERRKALNLGPPIPLGTFGGGNGNGGPGAGVSSQTASGN